MAFLYFIPFILLTAFIVLNVLIGLVVNTTSEIAAAELAEEVSDMTPEEQKEQLVQQLAQIQKQLNQFSKSLENYNK